MQYAKLQTFCKDPKKPKLCKWIKEAYFPSKTSGARRPKRLRNSKNVRLVGYPAQLILMASRTPYNTTANIKELFISIRRIITTWKTPQLNSYKRQFIWIWSNSTMYLLHIWAVVKHFDSQKWQAWEDYLALHILYSEVLLSSMSPLETAIVAVEREPIKLISIHINNASNNNESKQLQKKHLMLSNDQHKMKVISIEKHVDTISTDLYHETTE